MKFLKGVYSSLPLSPISLNKCNRDIFPFAKSYKLLLTHKQSVSKPFKHLYMDFWVSLVIANNGGHYFLLIVDDFSRYQWIFFLATKSNVESVFISFINMMEWHFNTKIQSMQTDGDMEFLFVIVVLYKFGVNHKKNMPSHPIIKWLNRVPT